MFLNLFYVEIDYEIHKMSISLPFYSKSLLNMHSSILSCPQIYGDQSQAPVLEDFQTLPSPLP